MGATQFLFFDPLGKYVLELIIALLATLVNKITDWNLKGKELFFKAPKILTGAVNWTMFTVGMALAIPPYNGSVNKLVVMALMLVVFIIVVAGCWRVVGMGQRWKGSKDFADLAMYGGPLTIAILSLIIFIIVDVTV